MSFRRLSPSALMLAVALGVAACGTSSSNNNASAQGHTVPGGGTSAGPPAGSVKLESAKVSGVGTVLVNGAGRTLYVFAPDKHAKVTCLASCQGVWPAEVAPGSGPAKATGAVKQSLIGSDSNPTGGRVVTYDGWPLYAYDGDGGPGMASGQGLDLNGGLWWVIRPNGQVVMSK